MSSTGEGLVTHTFPTDDIGNLIMHPNETTKEVVRVKVQPSGMFVAFIIDMIMALTCKDRNQANEVWREFPVETKKLIQSDLVQDEGKVAC